MADKSNAQKGSSNSGGTTAGSKASTVKRFGSYNESAVHKPVPGKGGRGGSSK